MSQWQIVSLIALLGWLVLAVGGFRSMRADRNIVIRSILIWGGIVVVIAVLAINRDTIAAMLAPIRATMP
jgi:hypothetical protein